MYLINNNICSSSGSPPLSAQVPVRLKVVDRLAVTAHLRAADAAPLTPLATVTAQSQLDDRKLNCTIVEGNDEQTFAVEHEEGLVRLQDQLDYEATSFYQLTVRATDTFSGKWADVQLALQVVTTTDYSSRSTCTT